MNRARGTENTVDRGNANNHHGDDYGARSRRPLCVRLGGATERDSNRQHGKRNFTRHKGSLQS